jgi:hypothetical protein
VDVRVEAGDELVVTVGFGDPASGFSVGGERFGVEALRGQHRQVAGVGAEAGAVLADVGVGAGALGLGTNAEPAREPGLDRGVCFQSPVSSGSVARPGGGSAGSEPRRSLARVSARSYSARTVVSNSFP